MRYQGPLLALLPVSLLGLLGTDQGFDLGTEISRCERGYGPHTASCQIQLPPGVIRTNGVVIGGNVVGTNQVGTCLIGHGSGKTSTMPFGDPGAAGTMLVYTGPPGGIVLDMRAGDYECLRDLAIHMDGAAIGVRLTANNLDSVTAQDPSLEHVAIGGNLLRPAGIALQITGPSKNDQVDALVATQFYCYDVDTCIQIDNDQAVDLRIGPGSKLFAKTYATHLIRGSLSLDGVAAGCESTGCSIHKIEHTAHSFRVDDGYYEPNQLDQALLRLPDAPLGLWRVVSFERSNVNVQCNGTQKPCYLDLVKGGSNAAVLVRGNQFIFGGGPQPPTGRNLRVILVKAAEDPLLVWEGNYIQKGLGVVSANGPTVRVQAPVADAQRFWNDRNLNGKYEPTEAVMVRP